MTNGAGRVSEEITTGIVRPISLRNGRGARLSFLGGSGQKKNQSVQQSNQENTKPAQHREDTVAKLNGNGNSHGNGNGHTMSGGLGRTLSLSHQSSNSSGRSRSKENGNRRSFFRSVGQHHNPSHTVQVNGTDMSGAAGVGAQKGMDWVTVTESSDRTTLGGGNSHIGMGMGIGLPGDKAFSVSASEHSGSAGHGGGTSSNGGTKEGGVLHMGGSVRKRLSLLRLGGNRKAHGSGGGNAAMGSLDEE